MLKEAPRAGSQNNLRKPRSGIRGRKRQAKLKITQQATADSKAPASCAASALWLMKTSF